MLEAASDVTWCPLLLSCAAMARAQYRGAALQCLGQMALSEARAHV